MRTATPIPTHLLTGPRPARWRTLLVTTAAALTLTGSAGGIVSAQEATPIPADCILIEDGTGCLVTAPESDRVDLAQPTFSNPTAITNPLFPISVQERLVQLGVDDGETLRAEASVLPATKTFTIGDQEVEATISQFVAYGDGRIEEVAVDYFAQDDAGNVWYFGEDVFNYENGVVKDNHGSWHAGVDGPPGMIMPANPAVGDVYRPENIPGFVFEETTVLAIDLTVSGPQGPITGAIEVLEHGQDDSLETKVFAPGYGEFSALTGTEYLVAAVSLPVDGLTGTMPTSLDTIATSASDILEATPAEDWDEISAISKLMTTVWDIHEFGGVPPILELSMDSALEGLTEAVDAEDAAETRQATIDVRRAALDLELQYRSLAYVDLDELALWSDQLTLDAAADSPAKVSGDVAAMETLWARAGATVDPALAETIGSTLTDLRAAADAGDLAGASELAARLSEALATPDADA